MRRVAPLTWLAGFLAAAMAGPPVVAAGEEAPQLHLVIIERFAFQPRHLELRPGDSVEWLNRDVAPHTASAEGGAWGSGELGRRARFRLRFDEPGSTAYFCAFHPHMRGEIVVVAP